MVWTCSSCQNATDDHYETCWSCGTERSGVVHPDFQHADAYEPPIPGEKVQFSLGTQLKLMTAFCMVFALLSPAISGNPNIFKAILVLLAIGYILLHFISGMAHLFSWLLAGSVQQWQRQYREDQSKKNRY